MSEQNKKMLQLYKDFVVIFNNWETTKEEKRDYYNYSRLVKIFNCILDILENEKVIEDYGIKYHKVIETGEII